MKMAIIQGSGGKWNYCPDNAPESFKRMMAYSDDFEDMETAQDAIDAANADSSVPKPATFQIYPK